MAQKGDELAKQVGGTFRFDVTNTAGQKASWYVSLPKLGSIGISVVDETQKAECIIQAPDETIVGVLTGQRNPQQAFMSGELKIKGKMQLAMKLKKLQSAAPKL